MMGYRQYYLRNYYLLTFFYLIRLAPLETAALHTLPRNRWNRIKPCRRLYKESVDIVDMFFELNRASEKFSLPIFPLKKTVKLPTEEINLNLYEERYLKMAEYVLGQGSQPSFFGAVYSVTKPQMVKRGYAPVTPMVETGDIGTLFIVVENEDGMIPSLDGSLRRRVRLRGVAIGRFQIDVVLQNGYDPESMPFIVVEASKVHDNAIDPDMDVRSCVVDLEKAIQQKDDRDNKYFSRQGKEDEVDESIYSPSSSTYFTYTVFPPDQMMLDTLKSDAQCSDTTNNFYRLELFSFRALSLLTDDNVAPIDVLKQLQTRSTTDRLKYIVRRLQRKKIWQILNSTFSRKR